MDPRLQHLCDRHGLFLRKDFLGAGGTPDALTRLVRHGVVQRVRHGAYVGSEQWRELDEPGRLVLAGRAALRTARCDAALSHTSALALLGAPLWNLPVGTVHLTRTDGRRGRREAGVAQHGGTLLPEEIFHLDTTPVTSPTRTAIDITASTDLEHSVVVLDWFLHLGMTTKQQLRVCADARLFCPGTLATDLAITLADARAESVGESRCRCLFWNHGIPMPESQVEVRSPAGTLVARVDFAWPDLGVFLEFDGKVKYVEHLRPGQTVVDAVLAEKRREEQICRTTGWRCIRLTWADLESPERTAAYVRGVLSGGAVH